jgi:hypothetical protein
VDEESVGKIQDYLEQTYFIRLSQNKVFEILKTTALERSFNPVDKSEHSHPLLAIFSGRKTTEKTEHYRSF